MIPDKIKTLIDGLAFDIAWELFQKKHPGLAQQPMREMLILTDAVPTVDMLESVDVLHRRQREILKPKYKKMLKAIKKDLKTVTQVYFE